MSQRIAKRLAGYIENDRRRTLPRHVLRSDVNKPVFYSQKKKRLGRSGLYRMVQQAAKKAGVIKNVHPHMLRHTFAVNALIRGVDIYLLSTLMGHSNIGMTSKYLHIVNAQIEGLGEKLDINNNRGKTAE